MGIGGIAAEVQRVAQTAEADGNARVLDGDYAGAKRVLTAAQKELRLLKRDALDEERKPREAFQDQRLKVSPSPSSVTNCEVSLQTEPGLPTNPRRGHPSTHDEGARRLSSKVMRRPAEGLRVGGPRRSPRLISPSPYSHLRTT